MQEKIIKEMARKLAEDVRKDGKAMQCFGPWNQGMKNNNTKAHTELEEELRKLKIKTIKIDRITIFTMVIYFIFSIP